MFDKVKSWFTTNPLIAIAGVLLAVLLFFPKVFRAARRRRVRRAYRPAAPVRRRRRILRFKAPIRRKRVKRAYGKNGKRLKPWQIKGSRAARLHMAKLRRMR